MYQQFNQEKQRWEKFTNDGKLVSTKKSEGPFKGVKEKAIKSPVEEEIQKDEVPESTSKTFEVTPIEKNQLEHSKPEEKKVAPKPTKTISEWLKGEKMEMLSDNGAFILNGISASSKVTEKEYLRILPRLAVRNIL